MKDHLKKSSETSKPVRLFWKFFLYAWSAVFLLILLIYVGLFGKLPSIEELENPSMMSSSEIYADDGTMMGKFYLKDRINVILDVAGGDFIQKNINIAAPEGRIVYIAFIRGARAEVNFGALLMKRLVLTGSTLRAQNFAQKAVMVQEILEHVYPHLESGAVKPVVDRIFPLEEAEQAQDYMQGGQHMGKIVLQM